MGCDYSSIHKLQPLKSGHGRVITSHMKLYRCMWFLLLATVTVNPCQQHNDVIKWKHFPRYWPFVRGIHRLPVDSPHKGQWRGALMFSLMFAWTNGWANNRDAVDLRRHGAHYDVMVMKGIPVLAKPRWRRSYILLSDILLTEFQSNAVSCLLLYLWYRVIDIGLVHDRRHYIFATILMTQLMMIWIK